MDSQKDHERGNTFSFRGSIVTIWDASYIFQLILVTAIILAYFSFFENISPIKRLCPFKKQSKISNIWTIFKLDCNKEWVNQTNINH